MANTYSTRFVQAPGFSGGPTTFYTVPAGYLAVVKSIAIVYGNVTISGVDAWLMDETLCKLARYTWFTSMSGFTNNGGTAQWWGAWVLNEGEALQAQTAAGTVDISASGYLLALP